MFETMKRIKLLALALVPALLITSTAVAQDEKHERQPSPKGAKVYIVTPKDGKTVKKKFKVVFGLKGMGICPAGITAQGIPIPGTGHHHLLVDVDKMPAMDKPLSAEIPDKIMHFGKGQTETMVELAPGKHTLQLVFADYAHVPHQKPVVSKKITITVE